MAALVNSTGWVRQLWWRAFIDSCHEGMHAPLALAMILLFSMLITCMRTTQPRAKKSPALRGVIKR